MATRPTTTTPLTIEEGNMKMERLTYTVAEVAQLLGISRGSAYTHVRTGEIPSITIGGRIVVPRRALDAMLDIESQEAS